jgi:hypothetical protein
LRRKAMARKFSELEAKMSPERRGRIKEEVKKALTEMPIHELRNAQGLSQKVLAEALHIQQPAVAKMEKRTDMYISIIFPEGGSINFVSPFAVSIIFLERKRSLPDYFSYLS